MAEYYISYSEIAKIIDQFIDNTDNNNMLIKYKAEILAALTGDFEQNKVETVDEMIFLWKNQIKKPSQLLLGSRYIRINKIMMDFLNVAFTSGFIDAIIVYSSQGKFSGFTISVGATIAIALWDLFSNVKKLDDWDFCIYMQALTHYKNHHTFTIDELKDWLPKGDNAICNMHNNKWDCDYFQDDETCNLVSGGYIEKALKSLVDKGLLSLKKINHKYTFKFKR